MEYRYKLAEILSDGTVTEVNFEERVLQFLDFAETFMVLVIIVGVVYGLFKLLNLFFGGKGRC